ncbi:MAG: hypothetical protein M3071_07420 [Actinomycetota bacterium]|nr:hypothetical protein [Actinomycetota bacterium]
MAGAGGAGGAVALAQGGGGVGSSGTGTVGPANTVSGTSTAVTPAGPPKGTAAEQTHPSIRPRLGGAHTLFVLRLTLATAPGHVGVVATDYRVQLRTPSARPTQRCSRPANIASVVSGVAHERVPIALDAPAAGWCAGTYRVTVFLERGPYCPAPAPGQPPPPCPEFATQELDVGDAHFTVTSAR